MLKMKLPQRSSQHRASDEEEDEEEERVSSRPCPRHDCPSAATATTTSAKSVPGPGSLQREAVYEWFVRSLGPAQRLEFACGLLDLCNPLELRFLGSCLEDLARKDCHYLRENETRANGLGGEAGSGLQQLLGDLCDPISRSKLIIYLALLGSENREVAGRLYRLLLLPAVGTEGLRGAWEQEDRDPGEELLLLYTMASLHPAFSFHQRVTLRERLERLGEAMCRKSRTEENIREYLPRGDKHMDGSRGAHNGVSATTHNLQQEAVHIESINIKHVQRRRADKNSDYTFEVNWSDNSRTSVTKSYRELVEFLLTLPKELSNENIDKTILDALHLGNKREELQYPDLEPIVKQIFSSPSQDLLKNRRVYKFFQNIPKESGHTNTGYLHSGPQYCKSQEDSSETSSQEEDVMHHMTVHKKPAGKCPVTNFVAMKSSPSDGTNVSHNEQNGTNWRKKDTTESSHSQHYINVGHQHLSDKRSLHQTGRETAERNHFPKADGRSMYKAIRVKPSQTSKTSTVKDPTLEVGSGHETCGETSSESYSSPPSPRHNRRESFESEEEKDGDTDSNSEDSTKPVPGFTTFSAVKPPITKLSNHLGNNEESTLEEALDNVNFPHFPIVPTLHCVMPSGTEKLEPTLPPSLPTEGKAVGMLVAPVSMSPLREGFHHSSPGIGVPPVASTLGESEKCIEILTSSLPVPSPFLPRHCQPSNPALPIQRLKIPTQGPAETCTVNGSTQTSLGLGSANAGFFSFYSPGRFTASPVTASDPLTKPISQVVSLNQVVPHLDGNAGAMPPTTNLKLVFPATNLPSAPSSVPYPMSGPSLASGVLPTPNANVLNTAATQPANSGVGQLQPTIPPTVPTHCTGPAPSPSPALTHSTAQSDSTSFMSAAISNASTNGTLLQPQQMGSGACGSCGRRCSCGNSGGVPVGSYYYPNPITGQMYTRVPPFIIPSICNNTYLSQAHQSNGTQFPVFLHQTPYTTGLMHDPVLGGQANYGMQQMASFARLYPVYPATNVVGNTNGSVTKKNGNMSCFNCGVTGHYAQDCKQPPMEANQQGTFRLRYAPLSKPSHDSLDSAD
ncbi:zinc finger CCHC domain-containing protein 2 isoform X3 [Pseudophryne corroboree]|uniref:zinc finger CCHC domain-containing protein 2 isoform X3 n=1 Tax=Pseudophryne corroboree TaxID=495146 RepID=UPI00308129F5